MFREVYQRLKADFHEVWPRVRFTLLLAFVTQGILIALAAVAAIVFPYWRSILEMSLKSTKDNVFTVSLYVGVLTFFLSFIFFNTAEETPGIVKRLKNAIKATIVMIYFGGLWFCLQFFCLAPLSKHTTLSGNYQEATNQLVQIPKYDPPYETITQQLAVAISSNRTLTNQLVLVESEKTQYYHLYLDSLTKTNVSIALTALQEAIEVVSRYASFTNSTGADSVISMKAARERQKESDNVINGLRHAKAILVSSEAMGPFYGFVRRVTMTIESKLSSKCSEEIQPTKLPELAWFAKGHLAFMGETANRSVIFGTNCAFKADYEFKSGNRPSMECRLSSTNAHAAVGFTLIQKGQGLLPARNGLSQATNNVIQASIRVGDETLNQEYIDFDDPISAGSSSRVGNYIQWLFDAQDAQASK